MAHVSNVCIFQSFGDELSIGNELTCVFIRINPINECYCIFNENNSDKWIIVEANDKAK